MRAVATAVILALAWGAPARAEEKAAPEPLDGPGRPLRDDLLDRLRGAWTVRGAVHGRPQALRLTAEWVLNHQFLRIHEVDAAPAQGRPAYEAEVFIGYDNASERYVAHWLDVFGGRWSETLGYGTRSGDAIRFVFEYPDGPFHNTFTWNPASGTWRFLLEQKDAAGRWTVFADQTATATAPGTR